MASDGTVTVRKATATDADIIGRLTLRLLEDIADPHLDATGYAAVAADLLQSDNGFMAFLAIAVEADDDRVVGMLTLAESCALFSGGHFGEVQEFFIDPDYRGGGLGQRMLRVAVEEGRRRKWQRLQVNAPSPEKNLRSYGFYKQAGFEDIGPLLRYFLDSSGS